MSEISQSAHQAAKRIAELHSGYTYIFETLVTAEIIQEAIDAELARHERKRRKGLQGHDIEKYFDDEDEETGWHE